MALVFIPSMLQHLTGGTVQVEIEGKTVRAIVRKLEEMFPGLQDHLLDKDDFRSDLVAAVDGEQALDLSDPVRDNSEVHFIPPIAGGV